MDYINSVKDNINSVRLQIEALQYATIVGNHSSVFVVDSVNVVGFFLPYLNVLTLIMEQVTSQEEGKSSI